MGIPGAVVFSAKKAWQQKNPRKKPLKSEKNLGKKPKVFKQEKNTRISKSKKNLGKKTQDIQARKKH